jgi:dethiobiotin synthetase
MGCRPVPKDADQLAASSVEPHLADQNDFYRGASTLSPHASALDGGPTMLDVSRIAARVRELVGGFPVALVEGVGALTTPLDRDHLVADFAKEIGFPLLLVARDQVGVVANVLAYAQAVRTHGLRLESVVLARHQPAGHDKSRSSNQRILAQRLDCPVQIFPPSRNDDDALADAADSTNLPSLLS